MPDTDFIDDDLIWAYGPDSGTADQRARKFATDNNRTIERQNPQERIIQIEPSGKPAGKYKVFVYGLTPETPANEDTGD